MDVQQQQQQTSLPRLPSLLPHLNLTFSAVPVVPSRHEELELPMGSPSGGSSALDAKRRKPDMWTNEERWIFVETFLQNGRDFKTITDKVKTKNKEQVRQYYYRALERVNKLLKPYDYQIRDKSCSEAVMALKCFWSLEKKLGFANKLIPSFAEELYKMIMTEKRKMDADGGQNDNFSVVPFQFDIQVPNVYNTRSAMKSDPDGVHSSSDGDSELQIAPSMISSPGSTAGDVAADSDPAFVPSGSKRTSGASEPDEFVRPTSSIALAAKRRRQQLTQSMSAAEVLYEIACGTTKA